MRKYFKFLNLLLPSYKKKFYIILLLSFFYSFLETLSTMLIIPLVNALTNSHASSLFEEKILYLINIKEIFAFYGFDYNFKLLILIIFILFLLIKNFYYIIYAYYQNVFFSNVEANISTRYFEKKLLGNISDFSKENSSKIIRDSNTLAAIYSSNYLLSSTALMLEFATFFLLIFSISFIYFFDSLIILIALVLFSFFHYTFIRKKIYFLANSVQKTHSSRIKKIIESFDLFKEIKIFNLYKKIFSDYSKEVYLSIKLQRILGFLRIINRPLLEILFIIILFIYLAEIITLNKDFSSSIVKLAVFSALAFRLLPAINRINVTLQRLRASLPLVENLYSNLKNYSFYRDKKIKAFPFQKKIILKNISFVHNASDLKILNKLNLVIRKGSKILILGQSGSGKSTLVEIIMGLIKPSEGKILVDGKDIKKNIKGWFHNLSYVHQKINLIDESILDNIRLFSSQASYQDQVDIENVVKITKIKTLIKSRTVSSFVGEKGKRISGGQIQRIGIARALLKKSQILVMDESTSNLDKVIEENIIKNIVGMDKNLTVILVSHKERLAKYFDKVYYLKNKKLIKIKG